MENEDEEQQSETTNEDPNTDGPENTVVGGRLAGSGVCADGKGAAVQPWVSFATEASMI